MNNRLKAELVFKDELEWISSAIIKTFVLDCFEKLTPDYFWDATASSTGKHHPKISNRKHGIVLHTKLVCWWAKKLYEPFDRRGDNGGGLSNLYLNRDVIFAGCLLHDIQKFGTTLDTDGSPTLANYTSLHGPISALQLEDVKTEFIPDTNSSTEGKKISIWIDNIINCVAFHMGKWTDQRLVDRWEETDEARIVQLADYCASKKVPGKTERLEKWVFPVQ